jgi:hypothetical protein
MASVIRWLSLLFKRVYAIDNNRLARFNLSVNKMNWGRMLNSATKSLFLIFIISCSCNFLFAQISDGNTDTLTPTTSEEATNETASTTDAVDENSQEPIPSQPKDTNSSAKKELKPSPSKTEKKYSAPILFREKIVFRIHFSQEAEREKTFRRTQKASKALEKAMTASEPLNSDAKLVDTTLNSEGAIEVRIRGYKVLTLDKSDMRAADFQNMNDYQEQVSIDFSSFMTNEFSRVKIQKVALQFFLSVFFALMGFVIFRKAKTAFNQADLIIEQKRESFRPFVFMSENLISGHTLGGLIALFLVIGRVLTYFIVVLTTVAAISGQFRFSRNIMSDFFSQVLTQTFKSFQSLLEAIPGLLLASGLLFLLYLSLKILTLFLKGIRSGRISWNFLVAGRIPVVKFWGTAILSVLFFPLIIAALFGRFHTPIETIAIATAAIIGLATLPVLISIATGSFILWHGNLRPGLWIRIGQYSGEITDISLHKMTIVPESGGRIHIPMIQLLYKTCRESKDYPYKDYQVKLVRELGLDATVNKLTSILEEENNALSIMCMSISSNSYLFSLRLEGYQSSTQDRILKKLSDAHDSGLIKLSDEPIKEVNF